MYMFLDAVEARCCVSIWTEVNYTSKIRNRKSKNPGHFDLEGLQQPRRLRLRLVSPRLMETFEVKTSRVFTLPVAYFACTYYWLPFIHVPYCSQMLGAVTDVVYPHFPLPPWFIFVHTHVQMLLSISSFQFIVYNTLLHTPCRHDSHWTFCSDMDMAGISLQRTFPRSPARACSTRASNLWGRAEWARDWTRITDGSERWTKLCPWSLSYAYGVFETPCVLIVATFVLIAPVC